MAIGNKQSAFDLLKTILELYGLEELTGFAQDFVTKYDTIDETLFMVELRKQPKYQERFAANEIRIKKGLPALSEQEYLRMERDYKQLMRASGLPAGFYDSQDDFQQLLANDVSREELNARIQSGYNAVRMSNPEVIGQMRELYGVQEGELAAYFLDPDKSLPILQQRAQSAQVAAQARLQAEMGISREQAEQLVQSGVTEQQAREGFATIREAQQLFTPNQIEQDTFTEEEQVGAVFGTSAAAQQRLRKRARRRRTQFEAGGGFATGEQGTIAGIQ